MKVVIGPDVAMWLAGQHAQVSPEHRLLAPTLLRSQLLAWCYQEVRAGRLERREAHARLDFVRALNIRLLGDRVLQETAFRLAEAMDWPDTFVPEYVALTRLQADALATRDEQVAWAAAGLVRIVTPDDLLR